MIIYNHLLFGRPDLEIKVLNNKEYSGSFDLKSDLNGITIKLFYDISLREIKYIENKIEIEFNDMRKMIAVNNKGFDIGSVSSFLSSSENVDFNNTRIGNNNINIKVKGNNTNIKSLKIYFKK